MAANRRAVGDGWVGTQSSGQGKTKRKEPEKYAACASIS